MYEWKIIPIGKENKAVDNRFDRKCAMKGVPNNEIFPSNFEMIFCLKLKIH